MVINAVVKSKILTIC